MDYRIEKREGAMVWKQVLRKPEKDMRILVDDGCVALGFAGGNNVGEFRSGEKKIFNEGGRLSKLYKKSEFCFYVFNREKPAQVKWGVGKMPVQYEDRKLGGILVGVCAYGHCDLRVHDVTRLWEKLPDRYTEDNVVQPEEIEAFIQREVISKITPILANKLSEIGDYTRVQASLPELGKAITFALPDMEEFGLHVEKAVIEGLDYTEESKDIIEKHRTSKIAKLDTDIAAEHAKQIKSVVEAMNAGQKNGD